MPPKKDTLSTLIFLAYACTVFAGYAGIVYLDLFYGILIGPVIGVVVAILDFFAVCWLTIYGWPDRNSFRIGFLYGFAAHILSFFVGMACLELMTGGRTSIGNMLNWALALVLGSAVWGLAAIPTCALFRHLLARHRKD